MQGRGHELPHYVKGSLGFREEEQESPVVCLQVHLGPRGSADVRPDLTLTGGSAMDLGRAEAAASCHGYFITHLLIVANGDFTAPLDLVVSCSSAPMEGKGRPAWG